MKPQHKVLIEEMHNSGISNDHIASTMTGVLARDDKPGEFSTDTIKRLTQKWTKEIDTVKGISRDFTVAERTVALLNE